MEGAYHGAVGSWVTLQWCRATLHEPCFSTVPTKIQVTQSIRSRALAGMFGAGLPPSFRVDAPLSEVSGQAYRYVGRCM